jgi:hypothetical protein
MTTSKRTMVLVISLFAMAAPSAAQSQPWILWATNTPTDPFEVDAFNTLAECKAARAEGTKRAEKLKQNRVAERAAIEADLAREIEAEMSSLTPNFDRVAEARRRAETRTNSLENLDSVLYTCLPAGQLPADLHLRLRAKE